ncbi:MAG: ribonuclease H [Hyphococcus sp.]|nr:MAG: ribonuclease H [Marinicaulis sp.]
MIKIYTDGACSGNPGPGGWGFVIFSEEDPIERYGGERETTNNRMEMMAVIEALKSLEKDIPVQLFTDSQYVKNGINDWIHGWKRNGWKTASKKPVKNKDLWLEIDALVEGRDIDWRWVKGHAGDPGNERADELARMGAAAAH